MHCFCGSSKLLYSTKMHCFFPCLGQSVIEMLKAKMGLYMRCTLCYYCTASVLIYKGSSRGRYFAYFEVRSLVASFWHISTFSILHLDFVCKGFPYALDTLRTQLIHTHMCIPCKFLVSDVYWLSCSFFALFCYGFCCPKTVFLICCQHCFLRVRLLKHPTGAAM